MGLRVSVFRAVDFPDCTADGVSGQVANLTLVNVGGPFDPTESAPAAWLVSGNLKGTAKIVVCDPIAEKGWPMFGGNYAATSDSRFGAAVEKITGVPCGHPVGIHDRYES